MLKLVKMKLLLLIVDELMKLCFERCCVVLLMKIHVLGITNCVVVVKLLCLGGKLIG